MLQLIVIFNGLVGLAVALVGYNSYLHPNASSASFGPFRCGEVFLSVSVGTVTFTGSIIVGLKFQGYIFGRPILLPARSWLNLVILIVRLVLAVLFVEHGGFSLAAWTCLVLMTVIVLILGIHLVIAIGGDDIPAVMSIMNSYSGWVSAFIDFLVNNDLFIITGAIVGSPGAYLSCLMCETANRSFLNVLLGGSGTDASAAYVHGGEGESEIREADTSAVVGLLLGSKRVVITPGCGMAVAQTQYPVAALVEDPEACCIMVTSGIHPIAGRLPGHTDVLFAEVRVPYDIILEIDEVNDGFGEVDVVLVVGVNDTIDPAAEEPGSPTADMSVLKVWDAKRVIVFKHPMAIGCVGVQSPLFFREDTSMLFSDAEDSVEAIDRAVETVVSLRG